MKTKTIKEKEFPFYTTTEVAAIMGVSPDTVRRRVRPYGRVWRTFAYLRVVIDDRYRVEEETCSDGGCHVQ